MDIIVTEWMVEAQLDLISKNAFSKEEYESTLLPDIKLLKEFPSNEKFRNSKFWGLATVNGKVIKHGYKMKWHNVGNGKVQLRLSTAIFNSKAFLCNLYVKRDDKVDSKEMLKFKVKIQKILDNNFVIRGTL